MDDPEQREYVEGRLEQMVVKPTGESGGKGVFIGPTASEEQIAEQRRLLDEDPARWIAQEVIWLSCAPTMTEGGMAPRAVDLRPFAVYGDEVEIVPGGLTRVALEEGSMVVNSSAGGGSKDTWVLAGGSIGDDRLPPPRPVRAADDAGSAAGRLVRAGPATAAGRSPGSGPAPAARRRRLMLARIAHDLYWLGRHLVRAEHTARMLDGLFQVELEGGAEDPRSVALSWESVIVVMGAGLARQARRPQPPRRRDQPAHQRPRQPGLDRLLRRRRARGRAPPARHDPGRGLGVAQHLPSQPRAPRPRERTADRARTRSTRT